MNIKFNNPHHGALKKTIYFSAYAIESVLLDDYVLLLKIGEAFYISLELIAMNENVTYHYNCLHTVCVNIS